LAGVTRHPDQEWMEQMARNVTMEDSGFLINRKYLLHDRDSKYCSSFRQVIKAGCVKTLVLPPRSPNLNAYAERWVGNVLLFPLPTQPVRGEQEKVRCRERLGGLLK
jgi:putative transposase